MFQGVENEKRFWLSAVLFVAHFVVKKRMTSDLVTESIDWADKFLERYSGLK